MILRIKEEVSVTGNFLHFMLIQFNALVFSALVIVERCFLDILGCANAKVKVKILNAVRANPMCISFLTHRSNIQNAT